MKKIIICLFLFQITASAQDKRLKWLSIEPHIGFLFVQTTDNTLQQNTTTARGLSFNPHITMFINQELECGLQPSVTIARSEFASIESGEGYSIGYLFRYYPKQLVFKETIIGHRRKFVFVANPNLEFKHDISTIYPNEKRAFIFSNHLQTQNFTLSAGLNVYFWRQFYSNIAIGLGYMPAFGEKPFYQHSTLSFGYTFQKNKSKK
jgi:hypothetical protein